jgi:hypothetical protein
MGPICCDSNDPDTVKCGFLKRLFSKTPEPNVRRLALLAEFVRDYLRANVPQCPRLSFEEWLATTSYNEARKAELRRAHDDLRGGRPTKRLASKVNTFVKSEPYPLYKWCRMINSRHDAFKVWSGPLFKAVEQVVYCLPEFIKHVPVPDRPAKVRELRRAGRRYYQTDFTSFEALFCPAVMRAVECQLYTHCLAWCTDVGFLCDVIAGPNKMRTRTGVKATVNGRRMSGDMCTSLGNGFTNLMLAKFLAWEQGAELYGFVEGDDGLFATTADLTAQAYKDLGFAIKIEVVTDPCRASFCGMVFADSGQIVRNPIEFLATFGWTSSFIGAGHKIMQELLRAKALSAVYETPHCPIVGAVARYALSRTRGAHPRFIQDGYHTQPPDEIPLPAFAPAADTRRLVWELYGISPDVQIAIEKSVAAGNFDVMRLLPATATRDYEHYASRFLEVG